MVYNIHITYENGCIGYLSIIAKQFCFSVHRQCILWFDSKEKAERIVKRLQKRWANYRTIEIREHTRILR